MENWTIEQILTWLGIITALIAGFKYLATPFIAYDKQKKTCNARFEAIEDHQDADLKRLNRLEEDTKQILLSVNVLLNHSIDNNHDEELIKRQKELSQYMIQR